MKRHLTPERKAYSKALHEKRWAEDPEYRERRREIWRESYNRRKDDPEYRARLAARQAAYYARRKAEGTIAPKVTRKPGPRRQCVECGALHTGAKP